MFNIHLHLFFLCLVLSIKKVESKSILKISKPVYKTNGENVVKIIQAEFLPSLSLLRMAKTGIITKLLLQKAKKFLLLSSFMLLDKAQLKHFAEKEDILKKSRPVISMKNNILPYPRAG